MRAPRALPAWFVAVLTLLFQAEARAQFQSLETDDLRLVYLRPTHAFLAPHVARCFENSLAFHRKLFGYQPSEKVTVLLADLSDSGNAGAGVVPRNNLTVQIAPLSFAYETMLANERMNSIMNHELVHVVANEQAGRRRPLLPQRCSRAR